MTSGQVLEITATGFWPDEPVSLTLHSEPIDLGQTAANHDGTANCPTNDRAGAPAVEG